jgi:peroxiredoxin
MNGKSGTAGINSAAKKGIILTIIVVLAGAVLFLLISRGGSQRPKIIAVGDVAPDFTLSTVDGKQVSLSGYRDKVVMVHFWATWCPPCVEEIPTIDKLHRQMLGKNFEVLAVSVDEGGAPAVGSFLQQKKLALPVLLDTRHEVAGRYGTFKFPETYIVDRKGVVRYKVIGPTDWTSQDTRDALQALMTQ